uniref:Uncharacterized protein n=1 Tax=Schistosoma mansoni TaxID=6183 RepID=A0A5K4ENR4_SCHMA
MTVDVTSRLHEQSELIMTLKLRADSEMERRKQAECKLLNELNKNHYLQQQLLECQQRVSDAEVNNRVLRSTLNDISYELLSQTLTKNSNTDLPRRDTSVQTGNEFCRSKVVSVEESNRRSSKEYLWKFRFAAVIILQYIVKTADNDNSAYLKKTKIMCYIPSIVLLSAQ